MAHDRAFAERVRQQLSGTTGLTEQVMFGGVAWMLHGNLAVGTLGEVLICRVGPEAERLLDEPGTEVFDLTGRPMKGWLTVAVAALADDEVLQLWLDRGVAFASSLPPKSGR